MSPVLPRPFPRRHRGSALGPAVVRRFRALVLTHYKKHARSFPWRGSPDPYHILVSEVMLQQTRTETVLKVYPVFVERYPTLRALAQSDTRALMGAWLGLGYNRRALSLRECARLILTEHGGVVPRTAQALRGLPGIGPATAASIAAFAYDAPVAFVETNIRRVYLYFFFSGKDAVHDREILPLVERTLDRRSPGRWYSALMDYGVMLKRSLPPARAQDPNRKSAHYTRQAPYAGSDRQIRGRVLRLLTAHPSLTPAQIAARMGAGAKDGTAAARLVRILAALSREGFMVCRRGRMELS